MTRSQATPEELAEAEALRIEYGRRIRAARIAVGLTNGAQAARMAGIGKINLTQIEMGRKSPSMATLDRMVKAWKINPKDLFKGPKHRTKVQAPEPDDN